MKPGPKPVRRWGADPLIRQAELWWRGSASDWDDAQPASASSTTSSIRKMADMLGISRGKARSWVERGLSTEAAEDAAFEMGVYPTELWPDWLDSIEYDSSDDLELAV